MENNNYFVELNQINVSDKIKTKGDLSYLSWAYAWELIKTNHPDAFYTVYERDLEIEVIDTTTYPKVDADIEKAIPAQEEAVVVTKKKTIVPINYFSDGRSCWVKVGVTVAGIEHIEMLPIMNNKNKAIVANAVTSTDVNKAIQRALTKAIARHGIGLYIYAGEDLPSASDGFNGLADNREDLVDPKFEALRQEVIDLITNFFGSPSEAEVDKYIRNNFGDVRISQTTKEHENKLLAAKGFLSNLK